jgi:hypothetical protein
MSKVAEARMWTVMEKQIDLLRRMMTAYHDIMSGYIDMSA